MTAPTPVPASSTTAEVVIDSLQALEEHVVPIARIPVPISYDIIRLFSEGLYQSPQKAVEELVSNSYDAEARHVRVLMPQTSKGSRERLWVIDDGDGLDFEGFRRLWRVAESDKADYSPSEGRRAPIGQFGIGKLAAYVLAWRLTHLSRVGDIVRLTSMDFRLVSGVRQNDQNAKPHELQLRELTLAQAQDLLREVETRDPGAWELLFGTNASPTWTAAGLSDFKDLYSKLSMGRLRWVLRTALPLVSDFELALDGEVLESSKQSGDSLLDLTVGKDDDVAASLSIETAGTAEGGIVIPGLDGVVTGTVRLFETRLTEGKSDRWDRSNGFFIRVRGRIINVDDELFGLPALNHATWSRFAMTIEADGLRQHLLSSREGVRESDPIDLLRTYLLAVFNKCRKTYDDRLAERDSDADVNFLLTNAPSAFVVEPLVEAVGQVLAQNHESYYVAQLPAVPEAEAAGWLATFAEEAAKQPFAEVLWQESGINDRAVRYRADTRTLLVNKEHPFIAKLLSVDSKGRTATSLFASSELLVDVLLQEHGFRQNAVLDMLTDRDRVLRLVAGQQPTTAAEVLRLLKSALKHETALERAVGLTFRALGFEYERRGSNRPGADGVLYGRLGRGVGDLEDFRLVYDSKQTKDPSVPSDKIDPSSLWQFKTQERADYGFFVAIAYDAELDLTGKTNRKVLDAAENARPVTLLKVDHLLRLVELHYKYGLPLTRLRTLFETAHTVPEVDAWMDALQDELSRLEPRVPLTKLLDAFEEAKRDELATPTVSSVRVQHQELRQFRPEKLTAALSAVREIVGRRFLEIDELSGEVRLHSTAAQLVAEVDRSLRDLFETGITASQWPEET